VIGLLIAPSGHPAALAKPSAPATPATVSATADVGFDWRGMTDYKEVFSSDSNFKQVGSTWTEPWTIDTDCALRPCGATLAGSINGTPFTATLSRNGLNYSGNVAIDNAWTCDATPVGTKLYITLTGTSTASANRPNVTSFTGELRWVIFTGGNCWSSSEYDMQVRST
jgi:hypothetical protein